MHDKKLAEFNYKVLNNILSCGSNLKKWKKQENDQCEICKQTDDVLHLVVFCNLAEYTWLLASQATDLQLKNSIEEIIFAKTVSQDVTIIISILSFLLYKYWLTSNLESKTRSKESYMYFLKGELRFRKGVYDYLQKFNISSILAKNFDLVS